MDIDRGKTTALAAALLVCGTRLASGAAIDALYRTSSVQIEQCVRAKAQQESFSGVISISQNDRPLVSVFRGVVASPGSKPIAANTRFNLGSMSKMFTAVAIGQLVDAGKIAFDDPVGKYVAGLAPETSAVTIRQLLTHSAGLGDFFQPQNMEAMLKARTASDLMPLIVADKPDFAPGSQFHYSNSGFALLGILIERVSGQIYGDYLTEHVFAPSKMRDTGLSPQPLGTLAVGMTALRGGPAAEPVLRSAPGSASERSASKAGVALPQVPSPSNPPSGPGGRLMLIGRGGKTVDPAAASLADSELQPAPGSTEGYGSPAGGLFSTAADMQRFATALASDRLLSSQTAKLLTSPQIVVNPAANGTPERSYGMGFSVGVDAAKRWYGHNGGTAGANAEFAVFPDEHLTITVLSNRDPPAASILFHYIKKLIFSPGVVQACAGEP